MPVHRNKGGEPVEEDTVLTRRSTRREEQAENREIRTEPDDDTADADNNYEETTVRVRPRASPARSDDGATRIFGPSPKPETGTASASPPLGFAENDPVAGWLVVTQGPGQGKARELGIGDNSIGRSDGRVRLDFGDDRISGSKHAFVTYDGKNRDWFIRHGEGKNLTYLDGHPVLQPTRLAPHAQLQLGDTHLRFVPFCCEEFDWEEIARKG